MHLCVHRTLYIYIYIYIYIYAHTHIPVEGCTDAIVGIGTAYLNTVAVGALIWPPTRTYTGSRVADETDTVRHDADVGDTYTEIAQGVAPMMIVRLPGICMCVCIHT